MRLQDNGGTIRNYGSGICTLHIELFLLLPLLFLLLLLPFFLFFPHAFVQSQLLPPLEAYAASSSRNQIYVSTDSNTFKISTAVTTVTSFLIEIRPRVQCHYSSQSNASLFQTSTV